MRQHFVARIAGCDRPIEPVKTRVGIRQTGQTLGSRTVSGPGYVWYRRRSGAQGRNRTTDTAIFSRMLYQLSYLGDPPTAKAGAL